MTIVDQSNWRFEFSNSSLIDKLMGVCKLPTILTFSTSAELVRYMADDDKDEYVRLQRRIDERIDSDPIARSWKKARTYLKDLTHFPRYRRSDYDLYHAAARARGLGNATPYQKSLADGLEGEIDTSQVIVPVGQILFHGRADRSLTNAALYPTFISTSLNPVVARMSAFRRAGTNRLNGTPTVYILTVGLPLPALWGQTGRSCEYELLLPPLLASRITAAYSGRNFDIVEAEILRRG